MFWFRDMWRLKTTNIRYIISGQDNLMLNISKIEDWSIFIKEFTIGLTAFTQ